MVLYKILWQNTMIGTFVPGCLDVEYFRGYGQAFVFWDPFKKKGKKDNAKPFAWGRLLAEHSEDESDGGDEGEDESDLSAEQSYEMTDGFDNEAQEPEPEEPTLDETEVKISAGFLGPGATR